MRTQLKRWAVRIAGTAALPAMLALGLGGVRPRNPPWLRTRLTAPGTSALAIGMSSDTTLSMNARWRGKAIRILTHIARTIANLTTVTGSCTYGWVLGISKPRHRKVVTTAVRAARQAIARRPDYAAVTSPRSRDLDRHAEHELQQP